MPYSSLAPSFFSYFHPTYFISIMAHLYSLFDLYIPYGNFNFILVLVLQFPDSLNLSFHNLSIHQFSRKDLSLAQFIPRIYNKIIIKILGYFWGVTAPSSCTLPVPDIAIPPQGEQSPVVIISYVGYSPPKCTCHRKQSHSSKYMILLECLHAQSHVSSPHRLSHTCPNQMRVKIQFSKQKLFVLENLLLSLGKIYWTTLRGESVG